MKVTEPTKKVGVTKKKVLQARTPLKAMVLRAVLEMLLAQDQVKAKPKLSLILDPRLDRRLQMLDTEVPNKPQTKDHHQSHRCHILRLN